MLKDQDLCTTEQDSSRTYKFTFLFFLCVRSRSWLEEAELRKRQWVEGIRACVGWWCIMHKLWITITRENGGLFRSPIVLGELDYCPGLCSAWAHCAVPETWFSREWGCDWQASGSAHGAHSALIAGNCPHLVTAWKGTALSRGEPGFLVNPTPWKCQLMRRGLSDGFPRDIYAIY